MSHDVFISHSSHDRSVAEAVCTALEAEGIRCWIAPRDILPGVPYGEALIDAIRSSHVLLLLFSSQANASPQVLREVERAVSKGVRVLPVRLEDVPPCKSLEFFVSAHQWYDAFATPLEGQLDRLAGAVGRLLASVKAVVRPSASERPSATGSEATEAEPTEGRVPPGWTTEKRTVKAATPDGDIEKEIAYYASSVGMVFVVVPPGELLYRVPGAMGKKAPAPGYRIRLTRPFCMGVHPVTVSDFARFVERTGYRAEAEMGDGGSVWTGEKWERRKEITWRHPGFHRGGSHPVNCVSWNDAVRFCEWLSELEGCAYCLPTDVQWEYACRAGSTAAYYWGKEFRDDCAWVATNSGKRTRPVGEKLPNAFGLHDMSGNVWEWCNDWWDPEYVPPSTDPQGANSGDKKIIRGASWWNAPNNCRSANRFSSPPSSAGILTGFRVIVSDAIR